MMENYELNIEAPPKREHNWFPKNHVPFNKGVPMKDWMDGRKIKKVMKCLLIGRVKGNATMAGANKKQIVGIKNGKLIAFNCAANAETALRAKGIKINRRNINKVCNGDDKHRRRAGGFSWFFANEVDKYKDLL